MLIAGVDEAGRGSYIGRVYSAAVVLPDNFDILCDNHNIVLKDSKKMTENQRIRTRRFIETHAIDFGIGIAEMEEIDQLNIYQANLLGMHRAIDNLSVVPDKLLIDGNFFVAKDSSIPFECIVNGDDHVPVISAASVLAKTYRDEYILDLVKQNPQLEQYGIIKNKGYGTLEHRNAIQSYGLTKWHRRSFNIAPKKRLLS
jgi:ribonuclease HII